MMNGFVVSVAAGLALVAGQVNASEPRYWVYLADKGYQDPAAERGAIERLVASADPHAVKRRELRRTAPGLFDARDLPVASSYEQAIAATGARVHQRSRWLNAVSVVATPEQLAAIRTLPSVTGVAPVRGGTVNRPAETVVSPEDFASRDFYGFASEQVGQIGLFPVHNRGGTGRNVRIGILDTGFVTTHTAFNAPGRPLDVIASYDFVDGDGVVGIQAGDNSEQHRHGTWILGCISAYWPDTLVGGAYDASVILCKTEDVASETPVEEDNYVAGLEFADQHGADVCTSSLGYIDWYTQSDLDGRTAVTTIAVNIATENGIICVTAAGNEGNDANPATSHLIAPADAMDVITCGAVDSAGNIAGFSSDGPTADGRVKPEVLARGVNTRTVSSRNNTDIGEVSGTSLSTPLVAAAVACIIGEHPCWTVGQVRAALFSSASRGGVHDPLFVHGYGIINASGVPAPSGCPGDFNADGFIDFFDYDAYVECFETGVCPPCASADQNGDDFVDFFDYDQFVQDFELGC
jgi:hypothetical protein